MSLSILSRFAQLPTTVAFSAILFSVVANCTADDSKTPSENSTNSTSNPAMAAGALADATPSIESKYLKNIRQLTFDFTKAGEGYFSPDGKTAIFQAVPREYMFYQIYTLPLDQASDAKPATPKLISTGRGRTTCSYFSPDGKGIIFASSHLDPNLSETEATQKKQDEEDAKSGKHRRYQWDFDPAMEIFAADLAGHNLRQLTNSLGYDAEGAYTPDGKHIVFCSNRGGNPNLYVMDADGANVRQLTTASGYNGGPFTSPNGKWVVFRSDRKQEGFLQLHVIGFDGQNDTELTDNIGVNWAPFWHPTKPCIVWTGADHSDPHATPNYDLWLMKYEERDGKITPGKITRITDHPAADVLPVFSPDGKRLMWTSNRTPDHSSQLFIADFELPE
ncbi:MAG TPA: biopolymer transporter Tol [Pirellulales bacterium]